MGIRGRFELDLQELQDLLIRLGEVTSRALSTSIEAFKNKDTEAALEVLENDSIPDDLAEEIDDFAIMLLTRQQPVATDLRKIVTSIKVANTLERISDLAANIAKATVRLGKDEHRLPSDTILEMHGKIQDMLDTSLKSYFEEDVSLARKVGDMDHEVDSLFKVAHKSFTANMPEDQEALKQIIQFSYIIRHLERIGDHTTNIAEFSLYLVKGKYYLLND